MYGYEDFGGPPTEYSTVGMLAFDGTSGVIEAPEASQLLGLLAGVAVLVASRPPRRIDG